MSHLKGVRIAVHNQTEMPFPDVFGFSAPTGFVSSFGNLEMSLFLVGPGRTTLPIAILQYLQWKLDPTIATPGQAALGFGLPLLWAFGGSIAAIGTSVRSTRVVSPDRTSIGFPSRSRSGTDAPAMSSKNQNR